MPKERLTRRDRKAAETGEPKKVGPKLTQEEQDELEEKELGKHCGTQPWNTNRPHTSNLQVAQLTH